MQTKEEKILKHRECQKKYSQTKEGKLVNFKSRNSPKAKIWRRRYFLKNRWKNKIWGLVNYAIKTKKICRKKCEVCKKENGFAHHDDYSKPLEVRWLCNFHHVEYHTKLKHGLIKI